MTENAFRRLHASLERTNGKHRIFRDDKFSRWKHRAGFRRDGPVHRITDFRIGRLAERRHEKDIGKILLFADVQDGRGDLRQKRVGLRDRIADGHAVFERTSGDGRRVCQTDRLFIEQVTGSRRFGIQTIADFGMLVENRQFERLRRAFRQQFILQAEIRKHLVQQGTPYGNSHRPAMGAQTFVLDGRIDDGDPWQRIAQIIDI